MFFGYRHGYQALETVLRSFGPEWERRTESLKPWPKATIKVYGGTLRVAGRILSCSNNNLTLQAQRVQRELLEFAK